MIYRLQKRLILISSIIILIFFATLFAVSTVVSTVQTSNSLDSLTDIIAEGKGTFPDISHNPMEKRNEPQFSEETKYSTRHFTIIVNEEKNKVLKIFSESIQSVTATSAIEYAEKALNKNQERGFIDNFRYKVYDVDSGIAITFVDGTQSIAMKNKNVLSTLIVFSSSAIIIIVAIILFSKKAVKPFAENYNKQKQFITDANHELKTPLTLILTDIDIAKEEIGENEWLDDIKVESLRMASLVNQMITLTRMDEQESHVEKSTFNLSDTLLDTVSEFMPSSEKLNKKIIQNVDKNINFFGNEASFRKIFSIILDNALKYCDNDGVIAVSLYEKGKKIYFAEENTYSQVNSTETNRLFDRFYRSDKARTSGSGFGIGLAIARAVIEAHQGEIFAKKVNDNTIGFYFSIKK